MRRTSTLLIVLMFTLSSFTASAGNLRGDVDMDGSVNIADVTSLIDYLLTGDASAISLANADSDQDGTVNIADVTSLIDNLLTGEWPEEEQNGYWVDLGLPSGTLWATRNIGASFPEDYGAYFAWGETETKGIYTWGNYIWCNGSQNTMTKYCTDSNYGIVDNKTELDLEDDAAYVIWGPSWRMPSEEQIDELGRNTSWTWTTQNGVYGVLFTASNGNTMFLPAAGGRDTMLTGAGRWGYYRSRTLDKWSSNCSFDLNLGWTGIGHGQGERFYGFSIRPVRASQN